MRLLLLLFLLPNCFLRMFHCIQCIGWVWSVVRAHERRLRIHRNHYNWSASDDMGSKESRTNYRLTQNHDIHDGDVNTDDDGIHINQETKRMAGNQCEEQITHIRLILLLLHYLCCGRHCRCRCCRFGRFFCFEIIIIKTFFCWAQSEDCSWRQHREIWFSFHLFHDCDEKKTRSNE